MANAKSTRAVPGAMTGNGAGSAPMRAAGGATLSGSPSGQGQVDVTPRVLYIDADDDLSVLLDRLEAAGTPAILVLPEGARSVRGIVAARLLKRRADAAGIPLVTVTTDRAAIGALGNAGITSVSTVGEARRLLPRRGEADAEDALDTVAWDDEDDGSDTLGADEAEEVEDHDDRGVDPDSATIVALPGADPLQADGDMAETQAAETVVQVKGRERKHGTRRRRAWRRWVIGCMAGLVAVLLAIGAWLVFFPAATITITYTLGTFDRNYVVALGDGPGTIRVYRTHLSLTSTAVVPGTGTQMVPDGHSTGTVALANQLDGVVHMPAGTILDAANGSRFVTQQDINVPGAVHSFSGTTNGQASVAVQAVLPGPASNVAAGTITGIEGRLAGALLVTNPGQMAGGTMRAVYSLTASDTAVPIARLSHDLAAREVATLNQRYARSPVRITGSPRVASPTVIQFTQGGRPYARVTVTVRTDMSYIHGDDVRELAAARRDAALASLNQRIVPGSERFRVSAHTQGSTTTVRIHDQARTAPHIDGENLKALLVGRSLDDARQLLNGSARNGGWTYALRVNPDLAQRLPQARGLITLNIRQAP